MPTDRAVTEEEIFEAARKNAQGTPPRKHHLVPASYLRRWAEEGQIRVTIIDEHRTFTTAPDKAARETDFYSLAHEEIDPSEIPPLLMETVLSHLEGAAREATQILIDGSPQALTIEQRAEMSAHIAFQFTRGHAHREESRHLLAGMYRLQYAGYDDAKIRRHLEDRGLEVTPPVLAQHRQFLDELASGDVWIGRPQVQEVSHSGQSAEALVEYFFARNWVVYKTPPILITCDEPVVPVGGPGSPRGERAGIATAGVIIYPLDPSHLLALFHPGLPPSLPYELDTLETADINRELLGATARWAFERPSRHITLKMTVPPPPPVASVMEGPLRQPDGAKGDLYRNFKPTRWSQEQPMPPWPVSRWWTSTSV
jgi:hypothetical protein